MVPELSILKHLLTYQNWSEHNDKLAIEDFPKDLQGIYSCIDNHHATNSAGTTLSAADLSNLVFSQPVKDKEFTQQILEQVNLCDAALSTTVQLINALRQGRLLKKISLLSYEIAEGRVKADGQKEFDTLISQLQDISTDSTDTSEDSQDFVANDLELVVNKVIAAPGLRWRLNTLNQMLGSLRKNNFGFIFARPETGKTTFLASEVTFMAEQLRDDQGPIIWLTNEQSGEEVLLRLYQAALDRDLAGLLSNVTQAQDEFIRITKDKLKVVDRANISYKFVEHLCTQYKPSLVVIDQLDAISGFEADRKDLQLGAIYRWARELAKTYCPVIGVCQADGTGEGVSWLNMGHITDAKTAKQAHADWILGIGKRNDAGYENLRYLHLSKNKLLGDSDTKSDLRHAKREVLIEADRSRFKDIH